jgi:iron(III) transport system ATP-binding protein
MNLSIRNLVKRFGSITALDNISLDIPHGALVCFLGPSGCGKTTLLRVIAGLEDTNSGELRLGDIDLRSVPTRSRNFGVVFQSYSLFPNMSAARNIGYGLECRGWPKPEMQARIREMLELVHLSDQADKLPAEMSGGQQQRVALARALLARPDVVFADEPTGNLDSRTGAEVLAFLRSSVRELGQTVVMVTHDPGAAAYADRVVLLADGRVAGGVDNPDTASVTDALRSLAVAR